MKVIVFLLIAGAASARHVPEEQFITRYVNGDDVIERRNDGYIRQNPENKPYVNSEFRPAEKAVSTKTNQRFVQSTVKYNGQRNEDSLNNINNYENEHRLRTYTEKYGTTVYIVQEVNVYTNTKEQKNNEDRNPVNPDAKTRQVPQQGTYNVGYVKSNEPKLRPDSRPAVNNNQESRRPVPSISIPIQNPQNENNNNITNHPKNPVSVLETVPIQPIPGEKPREEIDILPKTDSDDEIWLWATEATHVTSSEPGSLDDRAAFIGDQCPTGKAKVKGICVDKH